MRFKSDKQRKAVFANLSSGNGHPKRRKRKRVKRVSSRQSKQSVLTAIPVVKTAREIRQEAYDERQEEKAEHFRDQRAKAKARSASYYKASSSISDVIPFGQPILVGHHSEARHRRDIDKIHRYMRKSLDEREKADYYSRKIKGIESSKSISSDDPSAIPQLESKLKKLNERREKIKEFNKKARKKGDPVADAYILANLGGNIRSVKVRIKALQASEKVEDSVKESKGVKLRINKDINRVQIITDTKPPQEIITKLKRSGFRWSPRGGCWQRKNINNQSIYLGEDIYNDLKKLYGNGK